MNERMNEWINKWIERYKYQILVNQSKWYVTETTALNKQAAAAAAREIRFEEFVLGKSIVDR